MLTIAEDSKTQEIQIPFPLHWVPSDIRITFTDKYWAALEATAGKVLNHLDGTFNSSRYILLDYKLWSDNKSHIRHKNGIYFSNWRVNAFFFSLNILIRFKIRWRQWKLINLPVYLHIWIQITFCRSDSCNAKANSLLSITEAAATSRGVAPRMDGEAKGET